MEHELFLQITPADIYYKSSKDVSKGGRRLTDMIDHFNKVGWLRCKADGPSDSIAYACSRATLLRILPSIQISFWVAKEICGAPNLKQRVSFLKLFVHLAFVRVHRATAAGRHKALTLGLAACLERWTTDLPREPQLQHLVRARSVSSFPSRPPFLPSLPNDSFSRSGLIASRWSQA